MSAWIVRHGMWVLAAALVLLLGAGVAGTFTPWTAAALAFASVALLVGGLIVAGIVTEYRMREPDEADDAYFGAVTGGQPLSRTALRDTRRDLALSSRRAQARAKVSSIARHYRRHGSDA